MKSINILEIKKVSIYEKRGSNKKWLKLSLLLIPVHLFQPNCNCTLKIIVKIVSILKCMLIKAHFS